MEAAALGARGCARVIDNFALRLFASFLHGNSAPQTLMTSLYLHPPALAALAALAGRPAAYTHAAGPAAVAAQGVAAQQLGPSLIPLHHLRAACAQPARCL